MNWALSWRADPRARALADRHYNRQSVGAPNFVPPGRCLVLLTEDVGALWVTSWPFAEYVKHSWAGAWVNSLFRRERGALASELIRAAVAVTRWRWPEIPPLGMVTFVDPAKVEAKRQPGWCYKKAGFRKVGRTGSGLDAWQMTPSDMPAPSPPSNAPLELFNELA